MRPLRQKVYRDFSKATWNSIQNNLAPENSVRLGLNLDSDVELGSLVSRPGMTLIGSQLVSGKKCCGLHNYRRATGAGYDKLFASFPDSVSGNNDIYDVIDGTKSLEDDTVNIKSRFLTYLDSCLRLNGTDAPKSFNGTTWISTGGTFDLANMPSGVKLSLEFKDKVYVAGSSANPDRVDISSIANSVTRTISWDTTALVNPATFIVAEQEDGGGGITALNKVPNYVLIFKKRTLKKYDGSSAYPEDMINQGAPTQEATITSKGMCFWLNENGTWVTTGGMPKKISSFTVDDIIASISASDLLNVTSGEDGEHVFWSIPEATVNGEIRSNIVLKYNINLNSWDVRRYATLPSFFTRYVDGSDAIFTVIGDDNGNVLKFNTGTTDNGVPITYSLETQDWDFGLRMFQKEINRFVTLTENISNGSVMWRNTHKNEDWQTIGTINDDVTEFAGIKLKGNFFNKKITGISDSGPAKIMGFEFPDAGVSLYDNVNT